MATTFEASGGQDHERMTAPSPLSIIKPVSEAAADDAGDDGLTASQKMLSATSGSLLTSLLGALSSSTTSSTSINPLYSYPSRRCASAVASSTDTTGRHNRLFSPRPDNIESRPRAHSEPRRYCLLQGGVLRQQQHRSLLRTASPVWRRCGCLGSRRVCRGGNGKKDI